MEVPKSEYQGCKSSEIYMRLPERLSLERFSMILKGFESGFK